MEKMAQPALVQVSGLAPRAASRIGINRHLPKRAPFTGSGHQPLKPTSQPCHMGKQQRSAVQCTAAASEASTVTNASEQSPVVKAILFDMDGVLCNSEEVSREAGAQAMKELYGLDVHPDEFIPFTGTGEANFLGGVARKYGAPFDVDACKAKFFEIYMTKYALPGKGIGYAGARELVQQCRAAGLKTAVASSADLVKIHASLRAAEISLDLFDTIVSADAFERLKPAPDIFLAAAAQLGVPPENCVVIEDAVAGVKAARAAGMRVIGVTTTLSSEAMTAAAPDRILPRISSISVGDLTALKYEQQQQQQGGSNGSGPSGSSSSSGGSSSGASGSSGSGAQAWLNELVSLPMGYKTSRRDVLKLASLSVGLGSLYVTASRAKTLSYVSPKAILNSLLPGAGPANAVVSASEGNDRVAAFKRYISDLEKRGGGQQVPEFAPGLDWLNTAPLRMDRELRGKVVILDFWTYCCINCIHVLPDLAFLEAKYEGSPVAVVGVHSAKFDNEKDSDAIRNAVLRYEISHPVVNDGNMVLWRGLGVSSWPTLAVVSPRGRLIGMLPGEGHRQDLDDILAAALEYYGELGQLDATPLPIALEREKDPRLAQSPLRFPGKVTTDLAGGRLFISDSNNHRIVVTDLEGNFKFQVGGNGPGFADGNFEAAAFNRPQGLAYSPSRDVLYVADTEAHALREVDLRAQTVRTLAGNGIKGSDYKGGKRGSAQGLNSPWDLALDRDEKTLYVAIAGQHQIWQYVVASGVAEVFSGNGYERNSNGAAASTSWAQPSGLTLSPDGRQLFVADSESSAVRRLNLEDRSSASCVGGDGMFADNLFRFGDRDGTGTDALLQHPLAVLATDDGTVYVADSYNHRLKVLDPATNSISTVAGSGRAGFAEGRGTSAQLSEPGGLCRGPDGSILIADTNNSLIRRYDPATGLVSTLALQNVPPPRVSPDAAVAKPLGAGLPEGAALVRSPDALTSEASELRLRVQLPRGYHLTKGANSGFEATVLGDEAVAVSPAKGPLQESTGGVASATLSLQRQAGKGGGSVRVLCKVYFCQDNDACLFEQVVFEVPLAAAAAGAGRQELQLEHSVSAAAPVVSLPGL